MITADNTCQTQNVNGIRRTRLARAIALCLGSVVLHAHADLTSSATLSFSLGTSQVVACTYGTTPPPCLKAGYNITDIVGSYFSMDQNSNGVQANEKTPIGSFNGIHIGTTQVASGSHSGSVNGSETPNIDNPWTFFGNTGMHKTTSPIVANGGAGDSQTLDMSGWNVTWNGIASIPLNQKNPDNTPSIATINCTPGSSCSNTSSYTVDSAFHVNGAGFTTVAYTVHLEGQVSAAGAAPLANNDPGNKTILGNNLTIDVTDNDVGDIDLTSVTITTPATSGAATANPDGTVTYVPPGAAGTDTFGYTVDNSTGAPSNEATVTVDVEANVAPVAVDDSVSTNTAALDNAGGSRTVTVTTNDTDANNTAGLPGGIDVATVVILSQPAVGTCTANPDGTVTYSQTTPSVTTAGDSCTYSVSDIDNSASAPLASNIGTINIDIGGTLSDWPVALDSDIIPILMFDAGVPALDSKGEVDTGVPPLSGSYFTMLVKPSDPVKGTIFTSIEPGSDGGFIIGHDQIDGNSHTGAPTGDELALIDLGWDFFGSTGMSFTKNGGITGNSDGTLKFSGDPAVNGGEGKYQITWNGIPEIDLGGSAAFPDDLGFAIISCATSPCADGDAFDLRYNAHVPVGDVSGFGSVAYGLRMVGTVRFLDGALQTSAGSISAVRLALSEVAADPDASLQCLGDCFDYTITGVAPGTSVSVILPLAGGIPVSPGGGVEPELRVFRDNAWGSFITNAINPASTDTVKSAAMVDGGAFGLTCPPPGDAAYGSLTAGHQCLQVTITDNGLNDKDPTAGTIVDPSGLGLGTPPPFVDTRTSGSSGCTLSDSVSPSQGGAWWLLAGFMGWLGLNRRKS